MTWILDRPTLFLGVLALLALGIALQSGRRAWRSAQALKNQPGQWLPMLGPTLLTLVATGAVFVLVQGLLQLGPAELAMRRIVGEQAPALRWSHLPQQSNAAEQTVASTLEEHRGKVVLVNLWATWCPPCRKEMPDLERLQQDFGDQGLVILNLSDEKASTITTYLDKNPMSTQHGRLDSFPWPTGGRPTSYVVDRQGIVRKAILGARHYEQFLAMIRPHL